jgi:hypothetical protein
MCGCLNRHDWAVTKTKTGKATVMLTRGGFDAKARRRKLPGTCEAVDAIVALARDNPDKALVITCIGRLFVRGFAAWEMLENGEIEVRFNSGEAFLLAETTILRLA